MNVLFVLYHDFTANSAVHVYHWANELGVRGVSCVVVVPNSPETVNVLGPVGFGVQDFAQAGDGIRFPDGSGPDIVHAWTPRENVRRFCLQLRKHHSFKQFVHLEDNEWHLVQRALELPWKIITRMAPGDLDSVVPLHLSHPRRAAEFLRSADGVTVLIDRLREFVPPGVPAVELWPSAGEAFFVRKPGDSPIRRKLGIPSDTIVFAYTGNVHAANANEVRSLYLAVAILNREGHRATLVRTGKDFCPFLGPDEAWGRKHSFELGYIPHRDIPEVVAAADFLVQPGEPGEFNDYRFPSKLPEFLAVGRPVILPASNVGLHMRHGVDAYVLPRVDALAIVEAVLHIRANRDLYDKLSYGARAFFERNLSWKKSADDLLSFYKQAHTLVASASS